MDAAAEVVMAAGRSVAAATMAVAQRGWAGGASACRRARVEAVVERRVVAVSRVRVVRRVAAGEVAGGEEVWAVEWMVRVAVAAAAKVRVMAKAVVAAAAVAGTLTLWAAAKVKAMGAAAAAAAAAKAVAVRVAAVRVAAVRVEAVTEEVVMEVAMG